MFVSESFNVKKICHRSSVFWYFYTEASNCDFLDLKPLIFWKDIRYKVSLIWIFIDKMNLIAFWVVFGFTFFHCSSGWKIFSTNTSWPWMENSYTNLTQDREKFIECKGSQTYVNSKIIITLLNRKWIKYKWKELIGHLTNLLIS